MLHEVARLAVGRERTANAVEVDGQLVDHAHADDVAARKEVGVAGREEYEYMYEYPCT